MGMIKTPSEIRLLKKSAKITDSCIKIIENSLKDEITEIELRKRIGRNIRRQGASLSFQTLVACGKRSAMIHPKPHATNKIISGIGYVDFGASYKQYKTDITVPFIVGKINKKQRKIIDATIKSYSIAIKNIELGVPCWKTFDKTNKYLKSRGFVMKHSLGHGLGKKVHEMPSIVMPRKKKLSQKGNKMWQKIKKMTYQKNMIFTIEPGVYVKGTGGCRIENDIIMTKNGPKIITNAKLITV